MRGLDQKLGHFSDKYEWNSSLFLTFISTFPFWGVFFTQISSLCLFQTVMHEWRVRERRKVGFQLKLRFLQKFNRITKSFNRWSGQSGRRSWRTSSQGQRSDSWSSFGWNPSRRSQGIVGLSTFGIGLCYKTFCFASYKRAVPVSWFCI